MKLKISDDLELPIEAVTQTFAILGIRGSGKTNTAVVMFEEMVRNDDQCVVLDPTDAWYGVRSSHDGKAEGLKVYVFGGEHGDLPLEGSHGSQMADFVLESGASVVFSLRHLTMADQRRFAADFGERLRYLKAKPENRNPLQVFLDEAEEFVPQNIRESDPNMARMFGVYNRMVRRDRNLGLGVTLISQRPQSVNKEPLSQVETLICHRLLHKLDRKAVKESWVEGHDTAGIGEKFLESLASLGKGDVWIWSPYWLDIFKRVHIRHRQTFDSSATPKTGERPKIAKVRAAVDLEVLRKKLSETIDKAKANDPTYLKRRIIELERAVKQQPSGAPSADLDKAYEAGRRDLLSNIRNVKLQLEREVAVLSTTSSGLKVQDIPEFFVRVFARMREIADTLPADVKPGESVTQRVQHHFETAPPRQVVRNVEMIRKPVQDLDDNHRLRPGALRMLAACVQWSPNGIREGQVAAMAKVKRSGGSFSSYKSNLVTGGYIRVQGDLWYATEEGISHSGLGRVEAAPSTTKEMVNLWRPKLRPGAQRMLQVLIDAGGTPMTDEQLAEESNVSDSGGSFSSYKSNLITAGLAVKPERGMVAANKEALFL